MKIADAYVVEGNLYEFAGEDGMQVSFDCEIVAVGVDGKRYTLNHICMGKG
jgi:hypothetical protein